MGDKYEIYYQMLLMWLWAELHDKSLVSYLKERNYNKISIYGMSEIGGCLYYELQKNGVPVEYVIDRNKAVFCDCPVYSPDDNMFPHADLIIVTAEYDFSVIKELLCKKTNIEIMSLQQLLCNVTGLVL